MSRAKEVAGFTGLAAGLVAVVVGAGLGSAAVSGVMAERDQLQAQVGVLQRRQPVVNVTVTPRPSASPSPSPDDSTAPPSTPGRGGAVVVAQGAPERSPRPGRDDDGGGSSGGGSPSVPDPPAGPSDPGDACPSGSLLTVRAPLGALPSCTVVIGGSRD